MYAENQMPAGLKEEKEEKEVKEVKAEKSPTHAAFLTNKKQHIKEELWFMTQCHAVVPHAEVKHFCLSAGTEPGWYVCELVKRCPTAVKKHGKHLCRTAGVSS